MVLLAVVGVAVVALAVLFAVTPSFVGSAGP
jgi:hypothetical protein